MRDAYGKQVYSCLEEVVDPKHTAVIVVDMQNSLVSLDRPTANPGAPPVARTIIPALQELIASGRQAGIRIVYITVGAGEEQFSMSPAYIYYRQRSSPLHGTYWSDGTGGLPDDSWGLQVIPELDPQPEDILILKRRLGGFWETNLDMALRANGIETVVITGTATAGCVLDTAMGAFVNDYYTVFVQDCVSDENSNLHRLGVTFLRDRFDDPTAAELSALWQSSVTVKGSLPGEAPTAKSADM